MMLAILGMAVAIVYFLVGSLGQFLFRRRSFRIAVKLDLILFALIALILAIAGVTAKYDDASDVNPSSREVFSFFDTQRSLRSSLTTCSTSLASFFSEARGRSARGAGGDLAAGGAAFFGKRKPLRYAAVRVDAGAGTQTVGLRGKFTRVAQHLNQPDALTRAA